MIKSVSCFTVEPLVSTASARGQAWPKDTYNIIPSNVIGKAQKKEVGSLIPTPFDCDERLIDLANPHNSNQDLYRAKSGSG